MKKLILLLLISVSISCNNDDDQIVEEDYSFFLDEEIQQFRGTLNETSLFYQFGWNTYQMSSQALYVNGSAEDPMRLLKFILNQENGDNQFIISTPVFDTSSPVEYNDVFGLGLKNLGTGPDNFNVQIRENNVTYNICSQQSDYKIEVLKTEENYLEPQMSYELKVWFKISHVSSVDCSSANDFEVNDALILASFNDYKNF